MRYCSVKVARIPFGTFNRERRTWENHARNPSAKVKALWKQGTFTLIELLVCITIISILAGLMLPALSGAMDQARNVKCKSNLKQVHLAASMYADDNNGLVAYRTQAGKAWSDPLIGTGYVQGNELLYCPSSGSKTYDRWRTYGMYRSVGELSSSPATAPFLIVASGNEYNGDHYYKLNRFDLPQTNILLADCTQSIDDQHRGFYYFEWQGFGVERSGINPLHGKGVANCMMVDGHLAGVKGPDLSDYCRAKNTSAKFVKVYVSKSHEELLTF